jgi:hypothetical protein
MNPQVEAIISLFDEVFSSIGQKPLLENPEFVIDQLSADFYLKFYSVAKPNRVDMSFEVFSEGVTFWIDRTQEMPDYSYKMIIEDPVKFKETMKMIFSSTIYAEYKGNKTVLSFISNDNIIVGKYKLHMGLLPSWFSPKSRKVYDPYF